MESGDGVATPMISRRSVSRSRSTAGESRRTIIVALLANAAVTIAKLIGGLLSGSAAMLAEAAHSLADTANQGFLLRSVALSMREPTPEQPFGYGRVRFLWTFLAAIAMFLAGATFAVGFGIHQLLSDSHDTGYLVAYATLGVSALAEGSSWVRAVRQTGAEARHAGLPLIQYARETRDPSVKMVLFEDSVAVIGIALAFTGILAGQLTGIHAFDPAASIAIGLLLIGVAAWMGHDTSELLVGASARPAEREMLERTLREFRQIDTVVELLTMVLGPNSLLVAARVDFAPNLDEADIEELSEVVDRRLREVVPDVTEVFLDATTAPTARHRSASRGRRQTGAAAGEPAGAGAPATGESRSTS